LKWKGTDRRPIPDDWHQIGRRSSKLGTQSHPNRNATHPVNAMLNYAYGILESQVRMQVMAAGLDPTIGIFHGNARGQHGLVYDLMEPLRPIVDRTVLKFMQAHRFHPADFSITSDGVCRLNPEMAKCVARLVAADLESIIAGRTLPPVSARLPRSVRSAADRRSARVNCRRIKWTQ
jgi:CRISP-associated protein Cas1